MNLTYHPSVSSQQRQWIADAVASLRIPLATAITGNVLVQSVAEPSAAGHDDVMATTAQGGGNYLIEVRIGLDTGAFPVPGSLQDFFIECFVHELVHVLVAQSVTTDVMTTALCAMMVRTGPVGGLGQTGTFADWVGATWQDSIQEGVAETVKDAATEVRLFDNRTNWTVEPTHWDSFATQLGLSGGGASSSYSDDFSANTSALYTPGTLPVAAGKSSPTPFTIFERRDWSVVGVGASVEADIVDYTPDQSVLIGLQAINADQVFGGLYYGDLGAGVALRLVVGSAGVFTSVVFPDPGPTFTVKLEMGASVVKATCNGVQITIATGSTQAAGGAYPFLVAYTTQVKLDAWRAAGRAVHRGPGPGSLWEFNPADLSGVSTWLSSGGTLRSGKLYADTTRNALPSSPDDGPSTAFLWKEWSHQGGGTNTQGISASVDLTHFNNLWPVLGKVSGFFRSLTAQLFAQYAPDRDYQIPVRLWARHDEVGVSKTYDVKIGVAGVSPSWDSGMTTLTTVTVTDTWSSVDFFVNTSDIPGWPGGVGEPFNYDVDVKSTIVMAEVSTTVGFPTGLITRLFGERLTNLGGYQSPQAMPYGGRMAVKAHFDEWSAPVIEAAPDFLRLHLGSPLASVYETADVGTTNNEVPFTPPWVNPQPYVSIGSSFAARLPVALVAGDWWLTFDILPTGARVVGAWLGKPPQDGSGTPNYSVSTAPGAAPNIAATFKAAITFGGTPRYSTDGSVLDTDTHFSDWFVYAFGATTWVEAPGGPSPPYPYAPGNVEVHDGPTAAIRIG